MEKIVDMTKKWWENVGEDEAMLQLATVSPDGNVRLQSSYRIAHSIEQRSQQPAIVLYLFYNGSEEDGRANFKQFFDIGV